MFSQHLWFCSRGGGGACVVGGCVARGMCGSGRVWRGGGVRGRRDGHCSGQYASYWNAFLLGIVLPSSQKDARKRKDRQTPVQRQRRNSRGTCWVPPSQTWWPCIRVSIWELRDPKRTGPRGPIVPVATVSTWWVKWGKLVNGRSKFHKK